MVRMTQMPTQGPSLMGALRGQVLESRIREIMQERQQRFQEQMAKWEAKRKEDVEERRFERETEFALGKEKRERKYDISKTKYLERGRGERFGAELEQRGELAEKAEEGVQERFERRLESTEVTAERQMDQQFRARQEAEKHRQWERTRQEQFDVQTLERGKVEIQGLKKNLDMLDIQMKKIEQQIKLAKDEGALRKLQAALGIVAGRFQQGLQKLQVEVNVADMAAKNLKRPEDFAAWETEYLEPLREKLEGMQIQPSGMSRDKEDELLESLGIGAFKPKTKPKPRLPTRPGAEPAPEPKGAATIEPGTRSDKGALRMIEAALRDKRDVEGASDAELADHAYKLAERYTSQGKQVTWEDLNAILEAILGEDYEGPKGEALLRAGKTIWDFDWREGTKFPRGWTRRQRGATRPGIQSVRQRLGLE